MRIVEDGWSRWRAALADVAGVPDWRRVFEPGQHGGWAQTPGTGPAFDDSTSQSWRTPSGEPVCRGTADGIRSGVVEFGHLGGWTAVDIADQVEQDAAADRSGDAWRQLIRLATDAFGPSDEQAPDFRAWVRPGARVEIERVAPRRFGTGISGVQFRMRVRIKAAAVAEP